MNTNDQILINKFGQDLISFHEIESYFKNLSITEKRKFLNELSNLIIQTKATEDDIDPAIKLGQLKPSYTPCVKIKKGIKSNILNSIIELPENETSKVLRLFLSLFKIAYGRLLKTEKDNPNKWWLQDLSDNQFVDRVKSLTDIKLVIKKLFNKQGTETGAIITAFIPYKLNLYEKNIIEQQLKLYAFNNLYPSEPINIYNSINEDIASVTIIRGINELKYEEKRISIY